MVSLNSRIKLSQLLESIAMALKNRFRPDADRTTAQLLKGKTIGHLFIPKLLLMQRMTE